MASHMRTELVSAALNQAVGRTGAKEGLLVIPTVEYSTLATTIKNYLKSTDLYAA
jgi:hypothetical protein